MKTKKKFTFIPGVIIIGMIIGYDYFIKPVIIQWYIDISPYRYWGEN